MAGGAGERFSPGAVRPGEKYVEQWEIVACKGDYSAVINREAGTRHANEEPLAERLSRELSKLVYLVYPDAAFFGSEGVEVYESGRYARDLPEDPDQFLRNLGCALSDAPGEVRSSIKSVVVVEGTDAASAARALGFDAPPQTGSLQIIDGAAGAVISSSTIGDLSMFTHKLSKAFPKRHVYQLSSGPMPGRFLAWVVRRGKDVGVFEYPDPGERADSSIPHLDEINGRKTPASIAAALGVRPELLNLQGRL